LNSSEAAKLDTMKKKHERCYDVDWLRVFAVIMVFFFHSARFFDYDPWHVKNDQLSFTMTLFVAFVVQWIMPLFFVLSGESAYFSLSSRKGGQFIRERFQRLIIPFIFGVFVLAPPQIYFERVSNAQFTGSFFQFYPHYFDGLYGFGGNFAWMGLDLWYLLFLFIFSLLTLPIFLNLKKETRYNSVSRLTAFFKKPGAIFLLAIPLAFTAALTDSLFQLGGLFDAWSGFVYFGGWNLFVYIIFFFYGYVLASFDHFAETIKKHGGIALILGAMLSIPIVYLPLTSGNVSLFDSSLGEIFFSILSAFYAWFWVITILSLGSTYLSFNHKWLKSANEAALPFYILHQTVILTVGLSIVSLNLSVLVKYLIISVASMDIIIFLILIIRRINLLRLLFGMRLKKV